MWFGSGPTSWSDSGTQGRAAAWHTSIALANPMVYMQVGAGKGSRVGRCPPQPLLQLATV
jgi:hypothetical protein